MDPPMEDGPKAHESSFTRAERIQQLSEVDMDITTLLELTGQAIRSLAQPAPARPLAQEPSSDANLGANPAAASGAPAQNDEESGLESFKTAMNAFLALLHGVDVRLQRQILSLEEAGIINLKNASAERGRDAALDSGRDGAAKGAQKASLEPNGVGNIGSLDVGWLNSRSSKVAKEMEAELWERAREHLERHAGEPGTGGAGDDAAMQG